VLRTDVNCDVPRVYQLRVTVINPGTPSSKRSFRCRFCRTRVSQLDRVDLVRFAQWIHPGAGRGTGQQRSREWAMAQSAARSSWAGGLTCRCNWPCLPIGRNLQEPEMAVSPTMPKPGPTACRKWQQRVAASPLSRWLWAGRAPARFARMPVFGVGAATLWSTPLAQHLQPPDPVEAAGASWTQVACGQSHSCGISNQAALSCGVTTAQSTGGDPAPAAGDRWMCPAAPGKAWRPACIKPVPSSRTGHLWCWGDIPMAARNR